MSFRNRLSLFFVLIVLVPMVSVAVVLFRLIADNEAGKADAAVRARIEVVDKLYAQARRDAENAVKRNESDVQLAEALREGDCEAARERLQGLTASERIARVSLVDEDGKEVCVADARDAIAPATLPVEGTQGDSFGRLQVSVTRADGFTRRVKRLVDTDLDLVVRADDRLLHSSLEDVAEAPLPEVGTIEGPEGETRRVVTLKAPGFGGERIRISVVADREATGDVTRSRLLAGGILLGFFVLALVFALAVSRQLQQQVAGLLHAARRLGAGDFSAKAPTEGRDEFSALGEEFNKMSDQLSARLAELIRERERVQTSVRRLGEAVGSNLDRDTLLGLVVTTALEGVGAQGARVAVRPAGEGPMEEAASAGRLGALEWVLREAEDQVLHRGTFAEVNARGSSALAYPLVEGDGEHRRINGVVSVAREGAPFSAADRELFRYLAAQAATTIENVELHETVARESVTDGLTGLSNRARFDEALRTEVEAWRRGGNSVGLVMMDIDDFKPINDTLGHPQGDEVLRNVARVLRESLRAIDEPARYGGEEFAIVLRDTGLDDAERLAGRVRMEIEALETAAVDDGDPVRITASFGVAALPECAQDDQSLVAAADAALLQAKRAGKNRTVRARTQ